jgi:hypothetical protein
MACIQDHTFIDNVMCLLRAPTKSMNYFIVERSCSSIFLSVRFIYETADRLSVKFVNLDLH